jgi:hypothetical protein
MGENFRLAANSLLELPGNGHGSDLHLLLAGPVHHRQQRLQRKTTEEFSGSTQLGEYLLSPDFWNRTFQNWQSEFLAVGSMVVVSIYLRQRGSPESKPVGAARDDAGTTG